MAKQPEPNLPERDALLLAIDRMVPLLPRERQNMVAVFAMGLRRGLLLRGTLFSSNGDPLQAVGETGTERDDGSACKNPRAARRPKPPMHIK